MADTKISALTDGVTAAATDTIPAARAGANVYLTPGYIRTYILGQTQTWTGVNTFSGIVNGTGASTLSIGWQGFGFELHGSRLVGWWSGVPSGLPPDTALYRDTTGTLALRSATTAQTYRVYNTFTDALNYERLAFTWSSNVAYIKPENAGTGSARLFVPVTGSTTVAGLPSASTAGAGARCFVTDANSTTFLATAAGGGANKVPVVSDGTNWLIG